MIVRFLGLVVLAGCLGVVFVFESHASFEGWMRIFHWPAMVLTTIGPFALVTMCSEGRRLAFTFKLLFTVSARKTEKRSALEGRVLQKLSRTYYSEGPDALENVKTNGLSSYVVTMIDRLANRMPTADVREFLEFERDRRQIRLVQAMQVLSLGVRLTPSVGMLGTIVGMVNLLASLQDPAQIGSQMSLALLTTFYGLFFSLALWTPMQQKVERVMDAELEGYHQALRWVELLEKRKPANYFGDSMQISESKPSKGEEEAA